MDNDQPRLRIVPPADYDQRPIDLYAGLSRKPPIPTLRDDFRDFIAAVRAEPYSHAMLALLGFMAGLLLVIVPALVAGAVL